LLLYEEKELSDSAVIRSRISSITNCYFSVTFMTLFDYRQRVICCLYWHLQICLFFPFQGGYQIKPKYLCGAA